MKVTKLSGISGKEHSMELPITVEQVNRWQNGELVQNVFPHLNADEREFLITGSTPEEWSELFGEEEE